MMYDNQISYSDVKDLDKVLIYAKKLVLEDISIYFLKGKVTKDELFKEFLYQDKPITLKIEKTKKTREIKNRCMARVWLKNGPRQCGMSRIDDSEFCNNHIVKKNYGRIDEPILNDN